MNAALSKYHYPALSHHLCTMDGYERFADPEISGPHPVCIHYFATAIALRLHLPRIFNLRPPKKLVDVHSISEQIRISAYLMITSNPVH